MKRLAIVIAAASWMLAGGAPALAQQAQQTQQDTREDASQRTSPQNRSEDQQSQSGTRESSLMSPTEIGDTGLVPDERAQSARKALLESSKRAGEPVKPGEFEVYVRRMTGRELPRFGSDLLLPENRDFAVPATATVPPDYRINVGDTVSISLTGSAEGSVERTVDTDGNIFLPSVGTIHLAGVRQGDLKDYLARMIGTQFRNFRVGVRTSELRGIRVFVTGFANNPGAYSIGSLSTVTNAVLQAGGPSAGGSFRSVKLIRNGREVADFDLYELLLSGDRSGDPLLENEDVLLIPPAGPQVAVIGSVNQEAIYELRGRETLADVLALAGGINPLGENGRIISYRADDGSLPGPQEVAAAEFATTSARPSEIIQVLPRGSLMQPIARQSVLVRIEGEVERPGNYYVAAGTPMDEVVRLAGGLTQRAFPFGAKLVRQSIVEQQRENFREALDQFELTLASAPLTTDSSIDAQRQQAQLAGARETLTRLRKAEPDGRLVLDIDPTAQGLPSNLLMENGDKIVVPPRPTSVGVFGAVYRPASFQLAEHSLKVKDYLAQAGGPVRAADRSNIFVVRANGQVLTRKRGAMNSRALPGDVIFVPVKTSSRDLLAKIGQVSSILFQFGLAAAAVAAIN